jgi:lipopolysaccharide transport system ATP-binding protein
MSDTIIKVENLGKKYIIGHQQEGGSNYTALRDVISNGAKSLIQKIKHPTKPSNNKYEEFWSLNDVSFEIKQGEAVGIIGRNGAGKSTLLKILSRITEPTKGKVSIKGRVASLLEVGTGFHPELTGRENIYLNGAILGMSRLEIKKKFDEIVDFAEVEKFLDTPVKRYSSGMYVRLAFAVAAHLEPEILVVDEVLAVGDAAFQKKCLGKMGDVAEKEGRTVLFVSHNMDSIRRLCSRGIALKKGNIDYLGNIDRAINKYIEEGIEIEASYSIPHPNDKNTAGYAYKLVVENSKGIPSKIIPAGQPWQIRLYLTIKEKIESFVVALGFVTDLGVPLRTSWSSPDTIYPGDYEVIFRENLIMLGSGNYSIAVGLSVYGVGFQYVENAGFIKIGDFSDGLSSNVQKISSSTGILLNNLQISFVKK